MRLTEKKLDQLNPISMQDIQNQKDMMRAEFAMSARRLETSIDELKNKTTAHISEIAKKSGVITKLTDVLTQRDTSITQLEQNNTRLEARLKSLFDDLQIAKADAALKTDEAAEAERTMSRAKTEAADLHRALGEREHLVNRQVAEIAALKSHVDMVRNRVAEFADEMRQSENRLVNDRVDLLRVTAPSLATVATEGSNDPIPFNGAKGANGSGPHLLNGGSHQLNGIHTE